MSKKPRKTRSDKKTDSAATTGIGYETQGLASDQSVVQDFDLSNDNSDLLDLGPTPEQLSALEQVRNLPVSESARVQEQHRNTPAGEIRNPGRTDEYIEILVSRQPSEEAAFRGQENADKETGTELPEGQKKAPDGADYRSGNSITGAVRPATFAPWDDALRSGEGKLANPATANLPALDEGNTKPREPMGPSELPNVQKNPETDSIASDGPAGVDIQDEAVKDDLIKNLELAAMPTTDNGQLSESVDPLNPAEDGASKAAAVGEAKKSEIAPTATPDVVGTNTESEAGKGDK